MHIISPWASLQLYEFYYDGTQRACDEFNKAFPELPAKIIGRFSLLNIMRRTFNPRDGVSAEVEGVGGKVVGDENSIEVLDDESRVSSEERKANQEEKRAKREFSPITLAFGQTIHIVKGARINPIVCASQHMLFNALKPTMTFHNIAKSLKMYTVSKEMNDDKVFSILALRCDPAAVGKLGLEFWDGSRFTKFDECSCLLKRGTTTAKRAGESDEISKVGVEDGNDAGDGNGGEVNESVINEGVTIAVSETKDRRAIRVIKGQFLVNLYPSGEWIAVPEWMIMRLFCCVGASMRMRVSLKDQPFIPEVVGSYTEFLENDVAMTRIEFSTVESAYSTMSKETANRRYALDAETKEVRMRNNQLSVVHFHGISSLRALSNFNVLLITKPEGGFSTIIGTDFVLNVPNRRLSLLVDGNNILPLPREDSLKLVPIEAQLLTIPVTVKRIRK